MSVDNRKQATEFKHQIENKIQRTIDEFVDGKISREQFQIIYARYSDQLSIANEAVFSGNLSTLMQALDGRTIAVRSAHRGKAVGVIIYHNRTGKTLETLGSINAPLASISPVLNDFSLLMDSGKVIDRRIEHVGESQWLLFAAGKVSTIVTEFRNEPAHAQIEEMERLHRDFEQANAAQLKRNDVNGKLLAYPFTAFIEKRMRGQ